MENLIEHSKKLLDKLVLCVDQLVKTSQHLTLQFPTLLRYVAEHNITQKTHRRMSTCYFTTFHTEMAAEAVGRVCRLRLVPAEVPKATVGKNKELRRWTVLSGATIIMVI